MKTTPEMLSAVKRLGAEFDVHPAALLAVIETESGGVTSALVNGRQEPLIRFEGHYFDKRLSGATLAKARKAGLSNPKAGAVKNPASQQARWDKLLTPAMMIDTQAAYESCSWGVGQVMGSHWKALGYASVLDLVNEARSGLEGQARLMLRFIKTNGLRSALKRKDWQAFASAYNGPAYKANSYDSKMADAFARYSKLNWDAVDAKAPAIPAKAPAKPADKPAGAQEPAKPTLPAPDPETRPSGLIGGLAAAVLASLAAALIAAQCAMPDFIINWFGYAAKCTGAQ